MFTKPIKIALVSLTALLAVLLAYNAAVLAAEVDQSNEHQDASAVFGVAGTCRTGGQSFTTGTGINNVAGIAFRVKRSGDFGGSDGLTLQIDTATSTPSTAAPYGRAFTAAETNALFPADGNFHTVEFLLPSPASIPSGTKVWAWLVQRGSSPTVTMAFEFAGSYQGLAGQFLTPVSSDCSDPWSEGTSDAWFQSLYELNDLGIGISATNTPATNKIEFSGTLGVEALLGPGEYNVGANVKIYKCAPTVTDAPDCSVFSASQNWQSLQSEWACEGGTCSVLAYESASGTFQYADFPSNSRNFSYANGHWWVRLTQYTSLRDVTVYDDVTISTVGNPSQFGNTDDWSSPPEITFEPLTGCVEGEGDFSCLLTRTIQNFFAVAPLTWFAQIRYAVLNESATTTHNVAFTLPASVDGGQGRTITIYQSGSSSGIVGRMNAVGTFGNSAFDWQDLVSMAVWAGCLVVAWKFVETLWETV